MPTRSKNRIMKSASLPPELLNQVLAARQRKENDSQCISRLLMQGLQQENISDKPNVHVQSLLQKLVQLFFANAEKIDFQGITFTTEETQVVEQLREALKIE